MSELEAVEVFGVVEDTESGVVVGVVVAVGFSIIRAVVEETESVDEEVVVDAVVEATSIVVLASVSVEDAVTEPVELVVDVAEVVVASLVVEVASVVVAIVEVAIVEVALVVVPVNENEIIYDAEKDVSLALASPCARIKSPILISERISLRYLLVTIFFTLLTSTL